MEEDAGDGGVGIEGVDGGVEVFGGSVGGEGAEFVGDAELGAGFVLILGVDAGGGIVADEEGDEADGFVLLLERGDIGGDAGADGGGEGFAVDEFCGHGENLNTKTRRHEGTRRIKWPTYKP